MSRLFLFLALVAFTQAVPITLNVYYPDENLDGGSLVLRGDSGGLSWDSNTRLNKVSANQWQLSLDVPSGATVSFKSLLCDAGGNNCAWQLGANDAAVADDAGDSFSSYPWFTSSRGTLDRVQAVYSPQLKNSRNVDVYLPPSYAENKLKTYKNVLIMHDGQNLFDPKTSFGGNAWLVQDAVDQNIYVGDMEEVLILGPWNTADRISEYTYSKDPKYGGGNGNSYLDFLEQTLYPAMAKLYRIPARWDDASVGIMGSSLGGLISCYAGWTRSQQYSKTGCMSSSFWWNDEDFLGTVMRGDRSRVTPVYLDSGNQGPGNDDEEQTKAVRDQMLSLGYKLNSTVFYYLDDGGQHNELYWRRRVHIPMADLYPIVPLPPTTNSTFV